MLRLNRESPLRRLRSPAIGALLILAILLGKAIVCQHAPGRAVMFDAMLLVPISLMAYHEGIVTALVAGMVAAAADVIISSKMAGTVIPLYLASNGAGTDAIARLFSMEVVATAVAVLSYRARIEAIAAERRTEDYLKKIDLLEKHSEAIENDARNREAEFERSLIKYSSLVYLLEESAQKIYSNLEVDRLFQSLFHVLEECFGATCSSVYLKNARDGSYFLADTSGADQVTGHSIPMILDRESQAVTDLENNRRGICWQDRYPDPAARPIAAVISGSLLDKGEPMGVINIHSVDGTIDPDARLMGMVCNIASIAMANARLFGDVQWLAGHDPLTRLRNRRTFHEHLESQIATRAGLPGPDGQFALLMLDIDHFKSFNDTYGHQAGDAVLAWFANHCQECAGQDNFVYRYGGEEFTVIIPAASRDLATGIAERIRSHIQSASFTYGDVNLKVTLSCGIAMCPQHGSNGDELVRKADHAMYEAKNIGRNTVVLSSVLGGSDSTLIPYEIRSAAIAMGRDISDPTARPPEGAQDGHATPANRDGRP